MLASRTAASGPAEGGSARLLPEEGAVEADGMLPHFARASCHPDSVEVETHHLFGRRNATLQIKEVGCNSIHVHNTDGPQPDQSAFVSFS